MGRVPVPLPAGTTTGRTKVGRWVMHVGAEAGTVLEAAEAPESTESDRLAAAIDEQGVGPAPGPARLEAAIESATEVTRRAERALELFQAVATGKVLTSDFLAKELDDAIDLLRRLDKADRFEDELRLARALAGLLLLLGRWAALVQTLRIAFRAASAMANTAGEAWARNELGTLAAGAGDDATAQRLLRESLRLREAAGDDVATEVTRHNLQASGRVPRPALRRLAVRLGVAAGGALAITAGIFAFGEGETDRQPATLPTVEIVDGPRARTRATNARFTFRAEPAADRFECQVDGTRFKPCHSPEVVEVDRVPGRRVFRVRAVAGGVRGEHAEHRWTVVGKRTIPARKPRADDETPPRVTVTFRPPERTKATTATFEFEADEPADFECSLDTGPFRECESPHTVEGPLAPEVHRFDVRAVDRARNRGRAPRQLWRVLRSEGPTVEFVRTPNAITSSPRAAFLFAADGAARFECALDGERPAACDPPTSYPKLAEGPHSLAVRAFDADDVAGPVAVYEWTIDRTDPVVTIVERQESEAPYRWFLHFEADDKTAEITCQVDGAAEFTPCTSPKEMSDVQYRLVVRATDAAGNQGEATWSRPPPPK